MSLFPFVSFDSIEVDEANIYLVEWRHKMGPLNRPYSGDESAHALRHEGRVVAITTTSSLIRDHVGGGLNHLTRDLAGCVVVSGYDCELYAELYADWNRHTTQALADGARKRTEVVWLNPACAKALRTENPQHPLFEVPA